MATRDNGKKKKGASRMLQLGYRQVTIWLSKKELEGVRAKEPDEKLGTLVKLILLHWAGVPMPFGKRFHL